MGSFNFFLVIGIILTVIFMVILFCGESYNGRTHYDNEAVSALFVIGLIAMACWAGFFYGVGDKHGANAVAKGHYKTFYVYDKEGKITDTIAEFPNN